MRVTKQAAIAVTAVIGIAIVSIAAVQSATSSSAGGARLVSVQHFENLDADSCTWETATAEEDALSALQRGMPAAFGQSGGLAPAGRTLP